MRIVEPKVEYWGEVPINDLMATLKWIERCARVCYLSEDKIGPNTATRFVLRHAEHRSIFRHSNLVYRFKKTPELSNRHKGLLGPLGQYFKPCHTGKGLFISGNLQAWFEWSEKRPAEFVQNAIDRKGFSRDIFVNGIRGELADPADVPRELRKHTCKWLTHRSVTHEIVRHQTLDFLQESQRYVDYRGELEVVAPMIDNPILLEKALDSARRDEQAYKELRDSGIAPQIAREVLPNCTAARIIISGHPSGINHFVNMRTTTAACPPIRGLATEYQVILENRDWLNKAV